MGAAPLRREKSIRIAPQQRVWVQSMRRFSPRELRRLAQRMGLSVQQLEGVEEVVIKLRDKKLVFENPVVTILSVKGSGTMYQVMGEPVEVPLEEEEAPPLTISDEDVQLVAAQAGVSLEEARQALEETEGDLAQAIVLLRSRRAGR